MTPAINGTVRCSGCHDQIPTDRAPGQVAWVTCANCGRSRQGAVQPLVRVAQAADAHLLKTAAGAPFAGDAGQVEPVAPPSATGSLPESPWEHDGADWDPPAVFTADREDAIRAMFDRHNGHRSPQ